jgi:heme/copper-type cytochrome/quinol oxidase subunit 2
MIISYFKRLIIKNREFILTEVLAVKGLMYLLMKNRNTGNKWTREEKMEIKIHLRIISEVIPVIIVILLPGGSLFLPFLAEVLDRRKKRRL